MSESLDPVAEIAAAYATAEPVLDLGALLWDGTCHAGVPIGVPLPSLSCHGLVTGAAGTGRSTTLRLMAEGLSAHGIPVFLADVKGDLTGLAAPGGGGASVRRRAAETGEDWAGLGFPLQLYALGAKGPGVPLRATVTDVGPVLLSRVLGLDRTQEEALGLVFRYADTKGLELADLKDLRAVAAYLASPGGRAEPTGPDALSPAAAEVIARSLAELQRQGADAFFGEPEFDTEELLGTAPDGRGLVSVLELSDVRDEPRLFSTFLMWLLADLFQSGEENTGAWAGRPRLVFCFDEAQLLFEGASREFLESVTQTVRLIGSVGVGVFFVARSPGDVPPELRAELGNRIQHAPPRASAREDAALLRAAAGAPPGPPYDMERTLTGLGPGEAAVTVRGARGAATPVAAIRMRPPRSLMGPVEERALRRAVTGSVLYERYAQAVDRDAAYERMKTGEMAGTPGRPAGRGRLRGGGTGTGRAACGPVFASLVHSAGTRPAQEISRSLCGTARRRGR